MSLTTNLVSKESTKTMIWLVKYMPSIVDKLNDFRGTRPAQAISAAMFLALGLYNLSFESGGFALIFGVLFSVFGVLAVYKLIIGESIVQSISG